MPTLLDEFRRDEELARALDSYKELEKVYAECLRAMGLAGGVPQGVSNSAEVVLCFDDSDAGV